jgi:hypothetical protein
MMIQKIAGKYRIIAANLFLAILFGDFIRDYPKFFLGVLFLVLLRPFAS